MAANKQTTLQHRLFFVWKESFPKMFEVEANKCHPSHEIQSTRYKIKENEKTQNRLWSQDIPTVSRVDIPLIVIKRGRARWTRKKRIHFRQLYFWCDLFLGVFERHLHCADKAIDHIPISMCVTKQSTQEKVDLNPLNPNLNLYSRILLVTGLYKNICAWYREWLAQAASWCAILSAIFKQIVFIFFKTR